MFGETAYDLKQAYGSAPLEEQLEALGKAAQAGKIRHVGLSNETPWGLMECCRLGGSLVACGTVSGLASMCATDRLFQVSKVSRQRRPGASRSAAG
jgi:aryl-alcohol dehydrogenase-like predicted oxidoreductase